MIFDPEKLLPGEAIFPTPTFFDESQFFGRTADVARVQQFLDVGSSVAISGKRRIGRSWFLQHLHTALPQERYLVVASDELKPDTIVPRQARLFLYALVYALHAALRLRLQEDLPCMLLDLAHLPPNLGMAFRDDLARLHQRLVDTNLVAVILLDEAEALLEFADEAGIVPAIVQQLTTNYSHIRVIVAGFNLSSPVGNQPPLFSAFAHHQLYGIGAEGAYDLVGGQLARYGVRFEPIEQVWARVVHLTGEEPALLRLLGQRLTEQARRNNGAIGPTQLQEAVEDFFAIPQADSWLRFLWQVIGLNQPIHDLLTVLAYHESSEPATQQVLISRVATQFYSGQPAGAVQNDAQRLCALGFLYEHEPTNCLRFSSDLLRQWIHRNRPDPGV
jgi:hypothetical protein